MEKDRALSPAWASTGKQHRGAGAGTYPGILDEDAGALPVGALSALATAGTADAADAALAAHAVPVSCCLGQVGSPSAAPQNWG